MKKGRRMTTSEFILEYSRRLARPLTGVSAEDLYKAFKGYMQDDFTSFKELKGRDQNAVLIMISAIRDKGYRPTAVTEFDMRCFKPNENRLGNPVEWKDDDYSSYIEFMNLVAERGW